MNKHVEELARAVGRALAQRWMRRCDRAGNGKATGNTPAATQSDPPRRRPRLCHRQHK